MSENVVITDKDVAKITNFKLDKGPAAAAGATENLAVNFLSIRHSTPEILRGKNDKKKYNSKTEVYSFSIFFGR